MLQRFNNFCGKTKRLRKKKKKKNWFHLQFSKRLERNEGRAKKKRRKPENRDHKFNNFLRYDRTMDIY